MPSPAAPRRETIESFTRPSSALNGVAEPRQALAEIYGENVFSLSDMRQALPKPVYRHMVEIRESGAPLDSAHADVIAAAIKDWAMARGATHYCHWFQPLTGLSAEKHMSFLIPTSEGGVITEFAGADLLQGEPDASSFPSGGIRSTFEARGYTGWDPTGDAFLMAGKNGKTLCIPSVFLGYGGQALDKKTPLLRSTDALSRAALRVLRLFGNTRARRVVPTVGCEQEYFLVDRRWFLLRPDLISAGRTLFGARPPKGQEMEDHYFGTIKERALAYMEDVERELYKLGIPITTRHNEVAPCQYEFAPVFERAHIAADHNQLTMTVMMRVAHHHGFECLLHEKPFAGINGSGKHNNWSLADDQGNNLLDPGTTPHENAQFLVFLTAVIRAVHVHADLLRAAVATPSNDHRLGANEAPPAIISVYLGETLSDVVNALISGGAATERTPSFIDIGVASLPPLPRHDSDRNRTSPFAFTGSKFEFRAVGSAQNVSRPNMVLNTIVAESLTAVALRIEAELAGGRDLAEAVRLVLQQELRAHEAVLFNGDNYSEAWHREAETRGLPNLRTCVDAFPAWTTPKAIELFTSQRVLSAEELQSRTRIFVENYIKTITIEAALMSNLGRTVILPAGFSYQQQTVASVGSAKEFLGSAMFSEQVDFAGRVCQSVTRLCAALDVLDRVRHEADSLEEDPLARAEFCRGTMLPAMDEVRSAADALEAVADDALWPLPKYHEMLFLA
jgi:glutamine synthetase